LELQNQSLEPMTVVMEEESTRLKSQVAGEAVILDEELISVIYLGGRL
jgi:hypothetical protein